MGFASTIRTPTTRSFSAARALPRATALRSRTVRRARSTEVKPWAALFRCAPSAGPGRIQPTSAFEGGSFGTIQGAIAAQGERGATSYNFSAQGGHTDNERPNNSFDSANLTCGWIARSARRVTVGGTLRWFHGDYADPGDRYTNDPDNGEVEDNLLATAFAEMTFSPAWTSRAVLGGQDRRFVSTNPQPVRRRPK